MRKPSSPGNRRQAVLREAHSRMNIILVSSSDRLWLSSSRRWRCYQIIMLFTSGAEKGNFQASTFMRVENFRAVRCAEGDDAECESVGCIMFAQTIQLAFCFPPATCVHIIQGLISNKKALSPDSHRSGADRRCFGSGARNPFLLALASLLAFASCRELNTNLCKRIKWGGFSCLAITRSFIFQEIDFGSFSGVVIEKDFKCFTLIYEMVWAMQSGDCDRNEDFWNENWLSEMCASWGKYLWWFNIHSNALHT